MSYMYGCPPILVGHPIITKKLRKLDPKSVSSSRTGSCSLPLCSGNPGQPIDSISKKRMASGFICLEKELQIPALPRGPMERTRDVRQRRRPQSWSGHPGSTLSTNGENLRATEWQVMFLTLMPEKRHTGRGREQCARVFDLLYGSQAPLPHLRLSGAGSGDVTLVCPHSWALSHHVVGIAIPPISKL